MKTPKRTKVCPACGETTTQQWKKYRNLWDEFSDYAVWTCPKCGREIDIMYKAFARFHRKNRERQLKHTIARLKALANREKPFDETWWEILGREDEIRAKYQARVARWKSAAKKYMEVIQEQEADRQMLVNASLWARAWKAAAKKFRALTFKFWVARRLARAWKERAKHYKTESQARLEAVRWYMNHWRKACAELEAHGLLQGFLDKLNNDEGGKE
ncbi:MAG: hypothetical protein Q4F30_04330 [Akkermansia sp.]|nr:hypothetical protein [Akkermansia sp.]